MAVAPTVTEEMRNNPASPVALCMDRGTTLPARLSHWAKSTPDRPFLIETTGLALSYAETHAEVRRWSAALRDRGVRRGDRVASFLSPSIDASVLWLALSSLGAVVVSIDRELRGEFLRHVLTDVAPVLICLRPEDRTIADAVVEVAVVPRLEIARGEPFEPQVTPDIDFHLPEVTDIAVIIYTSGTTGPAKGALIPWGQLANMINRIPLDFLSSSDVAYAPWPVHHVTGLSPLVTMAYVGGVVVFREKLSVSHFWTDVRQFGCTVATLAVAIPMLLALLPAENDKHHTLRFIFSIGGAMNIEFRRRFGGFLIGCYGTTEIGFPIINLDLGGESSHCAGWLRDGYQARLCDPQAEDVPAGEAGELWIKPAHPAMIFAGYLNRRDATENAFENGWYRTGDLLRRLDNGAYQFVDRIRDTIRRFGENISSTAIEYVIADLEEVIECCVVGLPSALCGHEVGLVLRVSEDCEFDPAAFYARLVPILPRHMLPAYIATIAEFPKTATNKIMKTAVSKRFRELPAWRSEVAL